MKYALSRKREKHLGGKIINYLICCFSNAYSIRGYAKKPNNLDFPYGVDFPDETGKMSQSDKGGRPPPRRSGGEATREV